jgi:hypothetical protein
MVEIRSYRRVFDLERRIYRIDRLRLNPTGVPVRGIVYFLALAACCLLAERLPLLGAVIAAVPWYLRDVGVPAGLAALFCLIAIEGRPFHLAAFALLRYGCRPRELSGLRARRSEDRQLLPGQLLFLPDGSDARVRRLRYRGPGAVRIRRRPPGRGQVVELARGGRLEVAARRERVPRRPARLITGPSRPARP